MRKMKPPFDVPQILIGVVGVAVCSAIVISVLAFVVGETVEHFTPQPTPDQVYGCTVKQQAPNGDCP